MGRNSSFLSVPDVDLTGKWVIISGANNGIGREAAIRFAGWGADIVLACRDPPAKEVHPSVVVQECQESAQKSGKKVEVEWWEVDMADLASVDAFADRWLKATRALDILCNNAGLGSSPGGEEIMKTKDGFEIMHQVSLFNMNSFIQRTTLIHSQVNFLSHVLLTHRLLPSLAKAAEPRIVCTTSCFHFYGDFDLRNFNGELGRAGPSGVQLYMNNKLWFQTWLTELQFRLLQHDRLKHITVNGVHPGYVNTGVWNLNKKSWKESLLKLMARYLAIDAQQGSLAILNAATSEYAGPDVQRQGVGDGRGKGGGKYFNRVWEAEAMPHCTDRDCRLRVWRKVNEELKLEEKGLLKGLGEDPSAHPDPFAGYAKL